MYSPPFLDLCSETLARGIEELSLSEGIYMAIVSHVEEDQYEIVAVKSKTNAFVAGETFKLRDTFCREVVSKGKIIALTEMDGHLGLSRHPLYENLPIEAYIAAPIRKNGRVWGTLNFSSLWVRREPFSQSNIAFIESASEALSSHLSDDSLSSMSLALNP